MEGVKAETSWAPAGGTWPARRRRQACALGCAAERRPPVLPGGGDPRKPCSGRGTWLSLGCLPTPAGPVTARSPGRQVLPGHGRAPPWLTRAWEVALWSVLCFRRRRAGTAREQTRPCVFDAPSQSHWRWLWPRPQAPASGGGRGCPSAVRCDVICQSPPQGTRHRAGRWGGQGAALPTWVCPCSRLRGWKVSVPGAVERGQGGAPVPPTCSGSLQAGWHPGLPPTAASGAHPLLPTFAPLPRAAPFQFITASGPLLGSSRSQQCFNLIT